MGHDLRGVWMGRLSHGRDLLEGWKSALVNRLCAWLWGVRLGRDCQFFGKLHFRRAPSSTITIGGSCRFRSSVRSNLAGINRACMISTLTKEAVVMIGAGCGLSGTVIGAAKCVELGNNVLCSANVTITDTDWHGVEPDKRKEPGRSAPVVIGDNVWIGMNTLILKGVTIGKNSVIGAGSVVTKSIPPDTLAAGRPARVIRALRG